MSYNSLSDAQLREILEQENNKLNKFIQDGVKLDMARGKPGADQLDLSEGMLDVISVNDDCFADDATDCRNYGGLDGIMSARKLFAEVYGVNYENIILGGNSSLNMMYDTIARAFTFGMCDSVHPWCKEEKIKFLCPAPGYDRHFAICELFGIEMVTVPLNDDGPDMKVVADYVNNDSTVKGIWCVPKYSNPTGIVYSDDVVRAFASLEPAAPDFRIFWDNAYAIHDLYDDVKLLSILDECKKSGKPNMPIMFGSTSKITYPGSGVALMAASVDNLEFFKKQMSIQTIGPDKINQLRHFNFFKNKQGVIEHMKKHADILRDKFEAVIGALDEQLGDSGVATWTRPLGGYFISFDSSLGVASDIYELCLKAGLTLTKVGATFPYGNDPDNKNIRIAPSFPDVAQLKAAVERFIVCVKIASINKILSERK